MRSASSDVAFIVLVGSPTGLAGALPGVSRQAAATRRIARVPACLLWTTSGPGLRLSAARGDVSFFVHFCRGLLAI